MRVAMILLMLTVGGPSQASDERQVRRDCTFDALHYCKAAIAEAVEKGSRQPIIDCMILNRDKLQAKCSRHLN